MDVRDKDCLPCKVWFFLYLGRKMILFDYLIAPLTFIHTGRWTASIWGTARDQQPEILFQLKKRE